MRVVFDILNLIYLYSALSPSLWETARYRLKYWGWSGGAMELGKLPVPGRPTNLDLSRARACCACRRCGWGLFGHFFSNLSFLSSFSLSLGDGPIQTEILSQWAVKPQINQPTKQTEILSQRAVKPKTTTNQPTNVSNEQINFSMYKCTSYSLVVLGLTAL